MPKVTYTDSKGLHQVAGTGVDLTQTANQLRLGATITLTDAAKTIAATDSGSTIVMAAATSGRVITMPAAQAGLYFNVHCVDTGQNIDFEFGTSYVVGTVLDSAAEVTSTDATKSILRVADNAATSDSLSFVCNGTYWVVRGCVADATKFSFVT